MGQRTEQINLEYKVEFEDGLRPIVCVYGIDSENQKVYGAIASFGVVVGAGNSVRTLTGKEVKEGFLDGYAQSFGVKSLISEVVCESSDNISEDKDWEQRQIDHAREEEFNLVRVQSPEHIQLAINRHKRLYEQQFDPLAKKFIDLFREFIREHPGYGRY